MQAHQKNSSTALVKTRNYSLTNDKGKLRIALTGYRSHPHVGGQGIYIRQLAIALSQLGHHVEVISGPPYPELPDNIPLIKLPSLNLYESENHVTALRPRHLLSFSDTYEWWTMLTGGFAEPYTFGRRLAHYLKNNGAQYDVIHDNQTLCYGLQRLKQPLVETIHHPITRDRDQAIAAAKDDLQRWGAKRWYSFLTMQKKVAQKLSHVVTVSNSSRQDIEQCFARPAANTQVIFNGIDTELFKPNKQKKAHFELLTTSSSDQPVKGFAVLLKALAELHERNQQNRYEKLNTPHALQDRITLTVIGQLNPKGDNAKLLSELKLENIVRFKSQLSDQEMVEAYQSATVYVCPSLYEGFGLPVAEAMACGTAVVSSDGGALPEVLDNCGLLVPAGDAFALADAIEKLMNNPELRGRYEQLGRRRAEANFCWKRVAEQYVDIYRQAIAHKHHSNAYQKKSLKKRFVKNTQLAATTESDGQ